MTIKYVTNRTKHKCCCSCKHNIRTRTDAHVECNCEIDGHYIGYIENFDQACDEWTCDEWEHDQPCGS